MFRRITIVIVIVIFWLGENYPAAGGGSHYEFVVDRASGCPPCKSNFVTEDSGVRIRRLNKHSKPGLFWLVNVTQELPNTTMVRSSMLQGHGGEHKGALIDYSKPLCDYLTLEKSPLFSEIKIAFGLPKSCPVRPKVYKIDNWRPDMSLLPPILPGGEKFVFKMAFEFDKDDVFRITLFCQIKRLPARLPTLG